jgi:hypothetical protein
MPNDLTLPDPARFSLTRFAQLLPIRDHIIGEDPGSFDGFREGMMQSLAPMTPYECVIAENLIAIEWEILQHRRMRDTGLRTVIRKAIRDAVVEREETTYEAEVDAAWELHEEVGGIEEDWEDPDAFDKDAAKATGLALATRAVSRDPAEFAAACEEIKTMGLDVVELMGEAYCTSARSVRKHDEKLPDLERRRREVKRDFDALQKLRPLEAEVIEEEVIEG